MRKIIVLSFLSLDGVMQAPGGPGEDTSDGFKYGGWTAPYADEASGKFMKKLMRPADLLLGRKTFEIWENYWPKHEDFWPKINTVKKYIFSKTRKESDWQNCVFITDLKDVEKLKASKGSDLKIWGSSELVKMLLKQNLVDEFWLNIYPVILGKGKRFFDANATPAAFKLTEHLVTPNGAIMTHYQRVGEVKTGSVGA
ncbi:MAG TPA: dihydrofolate reductase family protein [Flavobacteriaceae bacterium]|nr:dihydrofolate reductase family protein [Flavobacteriaceae bacterium]